MIHNLASPEINMVGVFRMYTHSQYLPQEYQSSLAELLSASSKGLAFLARHDPFSARDAPTDAKVVQLQATSRRSVVTLSGPEYECVRSLARICVDDFDGVCSHYEKKDLVGSKRPLASSQELVKFAMLERMSEYGVQLAGGPYLGGPLLRRRDPPRDVRQRCAREQARCLSLPQLRVQHER